MKWVSECDACLQEHLLRAYFEKSTDNRVLLLSKLLFATDMLQYMGWTKIVFLYNQVHFLDLSWKDAHTRKCMIVRQFILLYEPVLKKADKNEHIFSSQ